MVGVEKTSNRSKGAGTADDRDYPHWSCGRLRVGADVRLDDVGRAGLVAALHYGAAAAHGGGARMGTVERYDRWHRGRFGFRHLFWLALLHRVRDRSGATGLVARPSRAAGTAGDQYRRWQWFGAGCT